MSALPERYRLTEEQLEQENTKYAAAVIRRDFTGDWAEWRSNAAAEKAAREALKDVGDVVTALEATVERLTALHDYSERDAQRGPEVGCSVCFAILQGREALGQLPASLPSGKGKEG